MNFLVPPLLRGVRGDLELETNKKDLNNAAKYHN